METLSLFEDQSLEGRPNQITPVKTEGIKYAGSKNKLSPQILALANKVDARIVLDGFSGTTRVSQAFAQNGYTVISNDISAWSEIFGICYLSNTQPRSTYYELINHLNNIKPEDGWFTENYGGDPNQGSSIGLDGLKKPWQKHNTRKLDAIRAEIDRLPLSKIERAVALTSLMQALDKVDSTLGHFASYLNEWSSRSFNPLKLEVPALFVNKKVNEIYRGDVFDVLPKCEVDLAYFDPPYGSNNEKMPPSRVRYAAYYHVWTSICLNDMPELFGKAKRRVDTSDTIGASVFEEFRRDDAGHLIAVQSIRKLLANVKAKYVILSYSSGGRATAEQLNEVISESGNVIEVLEIDYKKNVMANMRWTNAWIREAEEPNREFLFLVEKSSVG